VPTIRGAGDAHFRVSASAPGLAAGIVRVGGVGVPAGTWALFPPAAGRSADSPRAVQMHSVDDHQSAGPQELPTKYEPSTAEPLTEQDRGRLESL